jgi:hypothetical protein
MKYKVTINCCQPRDRCEPQDSANEPGTIRPVLTKADAN